MKIHTNAGEVELTADMVRPGMVFEHLPTGERRPVVPLLAGAIRDALRPPHVAALWHLLGCDPAVAAREDVERYGVAPGIDAGAHGFARLRGGGAVDVRRPDGVVAGTVWESAGHRLTVLGSDVRIRRPDGSTFTEHLGVESPDAFEWSLIGLDARYARPEDVERLCCGERETADRFDPQSSTYQPARWCRCTLAIGDHAEHEDIATGTRWPAKVEPPAASKWTPVGGEACCACGGIALDGPAAIRILARNERGEDEKGALCQPCGERLRGRGEYRFDKGRLVAAPARPAARAEAAPAVPPVSHAAVRAWLVSRGYTVRPDAQDGYERFERANGHWMCLLVDGRPVVDEHDVEFFAGEMKIPAEQVRAGLLDTAAGLGAVALLTWICGMTPEAKRRAVEAPLVALVAAVPEGLDPVGWRAAVLALHEHHVEGYGGRSDERARAETIAVAGHLTVMLQQFAAALSRGMAVEDAQRTAMNGRCLAMTTAYARAVAPQGPRPKPERKRGGRDVRLAVDDGRDD